MDYETLMCGGCYYVFHAWYDADAKSVRDAVDDNRQCKVCKSTVILRAHA